MVCSAAICNPVSLSMYSEKARQDADVPSDVAVAKSKQRSVMSLNKGGCSIHVLDVL